MAIVRGRGVVEQIDQESRSSSAHDLLSSRSVSASSSTPPTTIESDIPPCQKPTPDTNITNIDQGHEAGESRRRSVRERHTLTSYNLNVLSGTAKHGVRKSVSGATLVNPSQAEDQLQPLNDNHALLNGNEMSGPLASLGRSERERRPSRRNTVIGAVSDIASSLGKRARDVVENSNSLSVLRRMSSRSGQRTHFYDQDGTEHDTSRAKRSRLSHADNLVSSSASSEIVELTAPEPKRKMWQEHGLYAGQVRLYEPNFDHPTYRGGQQPKLLESPGKERKYLPMPMFVGELKIRQGQDFRLPYDVLSLLPYEAKPKDGWVLKETVPKSRYMGYAAEYKLIDHHGQSFCRCTLASGCAEDCMNRTMHFECDDNNCNVGAQHCQNRQFAVLSRPRRLNAFERGVEVMETKDRGFGVRSVRSYRPHEIIIEYTGDIITQEEADRRMNQEYKDHKNFYMMTLQENLIIDAGGKKGSIARFVNHSCDPNCYMDRWTVRGEERIALFAGDFGISTGDELTYDYKFSPFSADNVQSCLCGSPNCRGVLGPKPNEPKPKKGGPITTATISSSASQWKVFAKRKLNDSFGATRAAQESDGPPSKKRKVQTLVQKVLNKKGGKEVHSVSRSNSIAVKGASMSKNSSSVTLTSKPSPISRKRKVADSTIEEPACEICGGVDSRPSNLIVFCDNCPRAFHQKCHNPVIGKDVINDKRKKWCCSYCPRLIKRSKDPLPAANASIHSLSDSESESDDEEDVACTICSKRNSPAANKIVYCSACDRTFHQRCHDPAIPKAVVQDEDSEWFCSDCDKPKGKRVSASNEKPKVQPHVPESATKSRKVSKASRGKACEGCKESDWNDKNHIVFCDECDEPWHQQCHIPVITQKYIDDEERYWFCNCCVFEEDSDPVKQASKIRQRRGIKPMHKAVLGEHLRKKKKNLDVECKGCTKTEWNDKNHILTCTECDSRWHQQCHIPFITRKYIDDPDHRLWFCSGCVFGESENVEWAACKIRQRRGIKPMHKKVIASAGGTPATTPAKTAEPMIPMAQSEPTGLGKFKSMISNLISPRPSVLVGPPLSAEPPSTDVNDFESGPSASSRPMSAAAAMTPPRRRKSVTRPTTGMTSRSQTAASASRLSMSTKSSLAVAAGRLKQSKLPFKPMGYSKLSGNR